MTLIRLPANGWMPRPYQLPVRRYLETGGKRAICVWHRRSGKDEVALHWTAGAAFERVASYWHMLPEASQARKAIWDAVNPHTGQRRIDEVFPPALRQSSRDDQMMIRFKNGSSWQVVGSDNFNSLVGAPPVGVVFSEWALANPASWAMLRPILAENNGWALFMTTPRGDNHARAMLKAAEADPDWFAEVLPATETGVFTEAQLDTERREYVSHFGRDQGISLYEQEYLCSFDAAVLGAFYAEELRLARTQRRIGRVPVDRAVPVQTAWDLGFSDATAIWFIQVIGREVRIVDYHEENGAGLDRYARLLDEKTREHGWRYSKHWFPHDVQQHELSTGVSRVQTLRSMEIEPTVVPRANPLDGINAVRRLLARSWIDEARCQRGLAALMAYRRQWDDERRVFQAGPLHDWSSHGADALRTFAQGFGDGAAQGPAKQSYRHSPARSGATAWSV